MFWEAAIYPEEAGSKFLQNAAPTYTLHSITPQTVPSGHNIQHTKNLISRLQVQWKVATFLTSEVSSSYKAPHKHTHTHCSMDHSVISYIFCLTAQKIHYLLVFPSNSFNPTKHLQEVWYFVNAGI